MVAASGPRVAKGIVALLAIALGAASGETLAPFPGTEPAIASCRAQAHMSVFEELEAQASSGAPGTAPPSVCARVVSNPGLRCVIAAASTRCRLARAEVRARGACDETRADKCEACVLRALAGASPAEGRTASGHAYVTRESTLPLEKTFEFESLTHTRGGHYTHYTIPPAMEWQVYLAELDAVANECARAEDAWRAEAAAAALARVLEFTKNAERAAETRDAAARQAAAAVLLEVEAARAAAADASHRLGALETQARDAAASLSKWRDDAETFAETHGETMRVIEKQSELIRSFINVTKHFRRFARKHTRAVWGVLEAARRDARATRDALDALAAEKDAWVKNRKNTLFQNTLTDGFIRALVVAPWRLARFTVRSSSFAWHVVMWAYVVLARVVPARYRVAAGLAAAVAARRASRRRAQKKKTRRRTPPVIRLSAKRGSVWTRPCCVNCARCGAKPPSARCSSPTLARSRDEKTSQKNSNTKQPRRKRRFATRRAPKKKQSAPIVVARPARRHVAREKNTFRTIGGCDVNTYAYGLQ